MNDVWGYPAGVGHTAGMDLTGFKVEASDGSIGKIDMHSQGVGAAYIVVDTGVWIFGKHVLLPAGTVSRVDTAQHTIHIARTKEEIKNSPEFDKDKHLGDTDYHRNVGSYYQRPRS